MELKKRVLNFKFDGEEIELRFPTVINMRDYGRDVTEAKKVDDSDVIDVMLDFLVKLGLPERMKFDLEQDHVKQIMNAVSPQDNKKGK